MLAFAAVIGFAGVANAAPTKGVTSKAYVDARDATKVDKVASLSLVGTNSESELINIAADTNAKAGKVLKADGEGGIRWADDIDTDTKLGASESSDTATDDKVVTKVSRDGDGNLSVTGSKVVAGMISSGDEAKGKVLTTDGSGNAGWKVLSTSDISGTISADKIVATNADAGKVLKVKDDGTVYWGDDIDTDTVLPASDDTADTGKVVTGIARDASGTLTVTDSKVTASMIDEGTAEAGKVLKVQADGGVAWAAEDELQEGSVGTTELADDAVTADKIADGAVGTAALADDAVTPAQVAGDCGAGQILMPDAAGTGFTCVEIVTYSGGKYKFVSDSDSAATSWDDKAYFANDGHGNI